MTTPKTHNEREELKPCPFCGSVATLRYIDKSYPYIECGACNITTDHYSHIEGAVKSWNRRSNSEAGVESDMKNCLKNIRIMLDEVKSQIGENEPYYHGMKRAYCMMRDAITPEAGGSL